MSTRKVLQEMLENCLGAAYQQEIRNRYQRNVEKDVYSVEEGEYDAGIAELDVSLDYITGRTSNLSSVLSGDCSKDFGLSETQSRMVQDVLKSIIPVITEYL